MYLEFIVGFGAGLCLICFVIFAVLWKNHTSTDSLGSVIKTEADRLHVNISELRKEYTDSRWNQIKKLGNDFARNPRAFKSDYESLIQIPETKAKSLDSEMESILEKCKILIENDNPITPNTRKNDLLPKFVKFTGVAVCVTVNFLVLVL